MRLESPVTLPSSHGLTSFEVLGDVLGAHVPVHHDETTNAASRPDLLALAFPGVRWLRPEIGIVG